MSSVMFHYVKTTSNVRKIYRILLCLIDFLTMLLKLQENINVDAIKSELQQQIDRGCCRNNYRFEINLIYKIIHEYTNYELHQWQIYGDDKKIVDREIRSLLIKISTLDTSLTWDCLSILSRYRNLYTFRKKINNQYIKGNK